jgi:hypothetical protein
MGGDRDERHRLLDDDPLLMRIAFSRVGIVGGG